ncbi:MAG: hypothetical protein DRH24_09740 [Deltaproteobacteria bacterium]|nr:MAG: hypothetical protein DRH24_09740 [Deltaproteobacteria bacterium]
MMKQVKMMWMVVSVLTLFLATGLWAEPAQYSASDAATQYDIGDLLFENSDFEAGTLANWTAT